MVSDEEPAPRLSLGDLRRRLEKGADQFCGVFQPPEKMALAPELGDLFTGYAVSIGDPALLRSDIKTMNPVGLAGYGTGMSADLAAVRALCEGLERYCSVLPPPPAARCRSSARQLEGESLDCHTLPRCSEVERARADENRLAEPDPDRVQDWVRGISLTTQRELWVPLTAVYLGLDLPLREQCCYPISTGFAAGQGYEDAILAGLLEVVERDSLALWWMAQFPAPRLGQDAIGACETAAAVRSLSDNGIDTHFLDLTTDLGVPVVGAVQLSASSFPHAVVMAACRPDGADAALRVLEECASLRVVLAGQRRDNDDFADVLAGGPVSAERFGLYHAGLDGFERFLAKVDAAEIIPDMPRLAVGEHALAPIVERLGRLGHDVLVVDVTVPEVRALGIVVVRVIVPSLMPLSFAHGIRYLAQPRLHATLERCGTALQQEPIPYA